MPTTSWLEGVFARGDRPLADVLERAYAHGARFDSWEDQMKIDVWEEAFARYGIDRAKYLGTIPVTARLPWDHIDVGLEEGFLAREYRKALQNRLSPALRQGGGRVRPRHEPGGRARRRAEARLLRLRRRVRPLRRCATSASSSSASSAPSRAARGRAHAQRLEWRPGARASRSPGRAQALPLRLREARAARVPVAPRRDPGAASRVPAPRAPALLLARLSPEARHDLRSGAVAGRGEPGRGGRHQDCRRSRPHRAPRISLGRRATRPAIRRWRHARLEGSRDHAGGRCCALCRRDPARRVGRAWGRSVDPRTRRARARRSRATRRPAYRRHRQARRRARVSAFPKGNGTGAPRPRARRYPRRARAARGRRRSARLGRSEDRRSDRSALRRSGRSAQGRPSRARRSASGRNTGRPPRPFRPAGRARGLGPKRLPLRAKGLQSKQSPLRKARDRSAPLFEPYARGVAPVASARRNNLRNLAHGAAPPRPQSYRHTERARP